MSPGSAVCSCSRVVRTWAAVRTELRGESKFSHRRAIPAEPELEVGDRLTIPVVGELEVRNRRAIPIVDALEVGDRRAIPVVGELEVGDQQTVTVLSARPCAPWLTPLHYRASDP